MTRFELLEYFYKKDKHMMTEKQIKEELGYDYHTFMQIRKNLNMQNLIVRKYGYSFKATKPDIIYFQLSHKGKDVYINLYEEKKEREIRRKNDEKALKYSKISLGISLLALLKDEVWHIIKYLFSLLKQ